MLGWSRAAMALLISTAIIIGTMCVICPVISNIMTLTDIVWVTAPENAAAPTVAYPPVNPDTRDRYEIVVSAKYT